ncbi:16S rRNA pseudouridine(516) synthase [Staphylococcus sp. HMSC068D03]|uniref:pseudouridine synthase n=1 Tax=Staphylococcus TaxID=1279 RepID=UPI0008A4447F|nr:MULTISPECIES: pseudouridine synthase [Staphylococcus]MCH4355682.1 rRNA pseudouridine synthase [Staphylococcus haemolyticus]OFN97535.1 16S rRNA pseudouridine(516) synthase [Staphylococcus sp. HMSC077B09]OFV31125.1 16S rRNA pseudouridine(516) synthase [Staphylococcus sp. HMSC14D10]OHP81544.1 16S rRNA pseudouridine(516) synthase [Staphylococcus sp. HMSC063A11]OHQ30084.1 16S rRNA pseudouridine(516) synthase [Staphylococcus sp. HMSC068D03]
MRLDKFLANMGVGTRTEVKQLLKKGKVTVNTSVEKSPKSYINPTEDMVCVNEKQVEFVNNVYIMLNKPKGYISATHDESNRTVIDLIPEYQHLNIFPVGRLDKDTEGLLLITNDGQFSHDLMSPSKHVSKTYEVTSQNPVTKADIDAFKKGIILSDGPVKPAQLTRINETTSQVTIYEGKYHQVKRMFHAIENEVLELKRLKIAKLALDENLKSGEYKLLSDKELNLLQH